MERLKKLYITDYQQWRRRRSEPILKLGWPCWNPYFLWLATDCARDQTSHWSLTTNPLNPHLEKVNYKIGCLQ